MSQRHGVDGEGGVSVCGEDARGLGELDKRQQCTPGHQSPPYASWIGAS